MNIRYIIMTTGLSLLLFACGDDPAGPVVDDDTLPGTPFQTTNIKEEPVLFDFGTESVTKGWDFKFHIVGDFFTPEVALNSGSSGSMGVQAANLGVVNFESAAVPDSGFQMDGDTAAVIGAGWFTYDFAVNRVYSNDEVYIIKGWNYKTIKLMFFEYHHSSFHFQYSILADDGSTWGATMIDSLSPTADTPIFYNFSTGTESTTDPDWDIAFATVLVDAGLAGFIPSPGARLNSVSGVEVAVVVDSSFEKITSVPADADFNSDSGEILALGDRILYYTGAPDHLVIGNGEIYLIKTVGGDVYKLQIDSYYRDPDIPGENSGYVSFRYEML